jgi:uncharacterized protein YbjT (DUF2867 family)
MKIVIIGATGTIGEAVAAERPRSESRAQPATRRKEAQHG